MVFGLVMALAASPAVAERLNLTTFHFVDRQALMLAPTAALMIASSFLSPRGMRRTALVTFALSFALIILALMFGAEVKGSRRWIFGLQPSEFIKPAFVVLSAWAFTEGGRKGHTELLGQDPVARAAAAHHRAAHPRARLRPDDVDLDRLDLALLYGRAALVLGVRLGGIGWLAASRLSNFRRTCMSGCCAFSTPIRRAAWSTPSRSIPLSRASCRAAGSAAGRARVSTSASCPTPTPTSSSR